jgi:hypothetical protein
MVLIVGWMEDGGDGGIDYTLLNFVFFTIL